MAMVDNTRQMVLDVLLEVEKKNIFVKDALHKLLFQKQFMSKKERSFITRMVEGVTEYQVKIDYVINCYSKKKVSQCKPVIRVILRMGVYQILFMDRVPDEAACNECVKLTKKKGFQNLSGFVNGVLRSVVRNKECIPYPKKEENLIAYYSVNYSTPEWLIENMITWYGEENTEKMLCSSLKPAKLTIRVNTRKTTPGDLKEKLEKNDVVVEDGFYVNEALSLKNINYVKRLPGYKEGEFFVQDESSMLLYSISGLEKRDSVKYNILDMCAAPGGKCTHFGQMLGANAIIEARDVSEKKINLIKDNIVRLNLDNVLTKEWDALVFDSEKENWADLVVADLPCSGLGIFGKKNDIKYQIRKDQLVELANLQRTILANAARYVKPGGTLLFSTCTINPDENRDNAKWFLEHFDFQGESIYEFVPDALKPQIIDSYMLQLLPGIQNCDGFFIAKFRKNSSK